MNELVYADDILLVDTNSTTLQLLLESIAQAGQEYGLTFNWKKLEVLPVRIEAKIVTPTHEQVTNKESMVYLGSLLPADGRIASEIRRRLGAAQADLNVLSRVWRHSTLNRKKKLRIFDACICSKLCYGLFTAALNAKDQRRIDGFQARCLRRIFGIPHAYYSRISNATVLQIALQAPLSEKIYTQQSNYLRKIAERERDDPTRASIFEAGGMVLRRPAGARDRGRPRKKWIDNLLDNENSFVPQQ